MQRYGHLLDGAVVVAAYEQDVEALLQDQARTCAGLGWVMRAERCRGVERGVKRR
jgi:hypothetical protein